MENYRFSTFKPPISVTVQDPSCYWRLYMNRPRGPIYMYARDFDWYRLTKIDRVESFMDALQDRIVLK